MEVSPEFARKKRDYARFIIIAALNGTAMVFSGVRGASSANGALLSEMAHDMGDTGVNTARALEYGRRTSKLDLNKFRKLTYFVVSSLGIVTSAKSGYDFVSTISSFDGFNVISENLNQVVNGAVIAGLNQASYVVSQRFEDPSSELVHDSKHHSKIDRNASLGLAACITAGSVVPGVAEIGGVAMGMYTAWHMRPTEHNLTNNTHHDD